MKTPVSVLVVAVLQALAAGVAVVSAFDLVAAAFELADPQVSEGMSRALAEQGVGDIDHAMVPQAVFVAGTLLLGVALLRLVAVVGLLQGRRWARTVLVVLIVVNLVAGLAFLFQGFVLRAALLVVVDVVLLALLFDRRTTAFLADHAARNGLARSVVER